MDIALFVAICANPAYVFEDRFHVAGQALHFFVHAAERIVGFVVIEFWNGANGPPTRGSVTVLTGYGERAVWISRGLILWITRAVGRSTRSARSRQTSVRKDQQGPKSELE